MENEKQIKCNTMEEQIAKCRKVIKQNLTQLFHLLKYRQDLYAHCEDDFIAFVENDCDCGFFMTLDNHKNKVRFYATVSSPFELEKDVLIRFKGIGKCKKL